MAPHQHKCPGARVRTAAEQLAKGLWNCVLLKAAGVLEKVFAGAIKWPNFPRTTEIKRLGNGS